MAVSCYNTYIIGLYNAGDGTYLNLTLASYSGYSYFTAVDASGRFISMSRYGIDAYY